MGKRLQLREKLDQLQAVEFLHIHCTQYKNPNTIYHFRQFYKFCAKTVRGSDRFTQINKDIITRERKCTKN